jgi:hypothetical protein
MRYGAVIIFVGLAAAAAARAESETRLVPHQPFAKAHVQLMARVQRGAQPGHMADVDVWAEGTRLKAVIANDPEKATYWIDGLAARPLRLVGGEVKEAKLKTLARGLEYALSSAPDLGNQQNDRVAGKPCRMVVEKLAGGVVLRRCFWRGIPLSVELTAKNYEFNLAATLVEEGRVTVADLQPPPGAPRSPTSMNAAR